MLIDDPGGMLNISIFDSSKHRRKYFGDGEYSFQRGNFIIHIYPFIIKGRKPMEW